MLARNFRLYEHLSPYDEDLVDLVPSRATQRSHRKLFDELHDISNKLPSRGLTILKARDLLEGLLEVLLHFKAISCFVIILTNIMILFCC
ncbi:LOW QUALITY PROTEIN: hypothetical protein PHMEG_00030090 [Phytophthora megakarya]|uniref:Uncharacterized protein n=1 Tax=Phytophthora megakarya TaxID=4795 RepID=A0A225V123_9STRA|nr:LOW QUALITY PROTEIN: hypothetical protein PHMEG_00030090 [Phytophthora megakarya]